MKKYIPDYEYLIYDLSNYTDEQLKGEARVKIMITLYRDVQKAENVEELLDTIAKAVHYLRELEDKQTGMEYFETVMRYIFSAAKNLTREDVNEIVRIIGNTYPEGSELVMTLADILREEGKEEGKKEGMKEGKREGIKAVALEMLRKGSSIHFVAEVTHMDIKEVEKLKRQVQ
ncbi:Rpn family recombination-promoting nuclease/putative transposase [Pseudogracilibacillus sp. SO30301A]|uniref:Rpn family recombination-promoting nuclease/putative transposase n=1 Tax=Pseudogracilibacillus sp. SO30301A TaxID=3098291 RepID=UPI00300E1407